MPSTFYQAPGTFFFWKIISQNVLSPALKLHRTISNTDSDEDDYYFVHIGYDEKWTRKLWPFIKNASMFIVDAFLPSSFQWALECV